VSVFQNRDDYGPRRLEVAVSNETTRVLTITNARFESSSFAGSAEWTRTAEIPAGATRNLRVELGPTDCAAESAPATVTLAYTLADGTTGTATLTPPDRFGSIPKIIAQDCAEELAQRTVAITLGDELRTEERDGRPVAFLDVEFTPTGVDGSVTIEAITRTILVKPAGGGDSWAVDATFDAASAPLIFTLDFVPSNCRLHTVAEDKRGTYFPFTTVTDAGAGSFSIAASTSVKEAIYSYIADYCGWDASTPLD
jgi:hypothetical protein